MRLLLISTEFPPGPGGIGTHAYQLAQNLVQLGWQVSVITRQDYAAPPELEQFNHKQDFQITSLPSIHSAPLDGLRRWQVISQHLKKYGVDLVVATGARMVWVAASLLRTPPMVAVGHGTEFGMSGWQGALTKWAFQRMDHVICVSHYTKNYMLNRMIQPSNISVIHNGADEKRFRTLSDNESKSFRKNLGFSTTDRLLLTVGNVTERKGQDVVIRALVDVLHTQPQTHYLIAGLPTEQERFTQLAQELGVISNVHFLGRVSEDDLIRLYNTCDVFLMTSRETSTGDFEGYGIAVIEAALCGKPSIVSGGSGLAEAVEHNETGLIVRAEDARDTALAILRLLEDNALRIQLGKNAQKTAIASKTWQKRVVEYDALFRRIIS